MIPKPITPVPHTPFREQVERLSGENVARCYQCGKCSAGCPVAFAMDLAPRRIMRAI
ncbi:MAG: heterodisulfide reductase subunit C, partial [Dehalococcoidia bacterium]|nr:heterodisulfide reductase subunit C [Dehalococcoidia bacterium]